MNVAKGFPDSNLVPFPQERVAAWTTTNCLAAFPEAWNGRVLSIADHFREETFTTAFLDKFCESTRNGEEIEIRAGSIWPLPQS